MSRPSRSTTSHPGPGGRQVRRAVEEMSDLAHEIAEPPAHRHARAPACGVGVGRARPGHPAGPVRCIPPSRPTCAWQAPIPMRSSSLLRPGAGDVEARFAAIRAPGTACGAPASSTELDFDCEEIYGIDELTPAAMDDLAAFPPRFEAVPRAAAPAGRGGASSTTSDRRRRAGSSTQEPSAAEFFLRDLSSLGFCDGRSRRRRFSPGLGIR